MPENWIEINREGKPIAVVRRTFPFAFVLESHFRFLYLLMSILAIFDTLNLQLKFSGRECERSKLKSNS